MTDEERVEVCQQEIRRLRSAIRNYEEERLEFWEWLKVEAMKPSESQKGFLKVKEYLEERYGFRN